MTTYKTRADHAMSSLGNMGLTPEILQRLAGFVVIYGLFETHLERAIWAVRGEDSTGKRPWTDSKPVSVWLTVLEENQSRFSDEAFKAVSCALKIIKNISDYRHGILHGALISYGESMTFIRNPKWGDIQRAKPTTDSHIDENLLDLALDCILTLFDFARIMTAYKGANSVNDELLKLAADLGRCHSQAYELRHLTDLMNDERY